MGCRSVGPVSALAVDIEITRIFVRSGWCVDGWSEESSALGRRVGVDRVSAAVDDDMVVEPAQGGEVRGVGDTAL